MCNTGRFTNITKVAKPVSIIHNSLWIFSLNFGEVQQICYGAQMKRINSYWMEATNETFCKNLDTFTNVSYRTLDIFAEIMAARLQKSKIQKHVTSVNKWDY